MNSPALETAVPAIRTRSISSRRSCWPTNGAHDRASDEEMLIEIAGRWCDYRLVFVWQREMSALHFSCGFEMKVPRVRRAAVLRAAGHGQRAAVARPFRSGAGRRIAGLPPRRAAARRRRRQRRADRGSGRHLAQRVRALLSRLPVRRVGRQERRGGDRLGDDRPGRRGVSEPTPLPTRPILLVGCGKMGGALLAGWRERRVAPHFVVVEPAGAPEASDIDGAWRRPRRSPPISIPPRSCWR